MRGQGRGLWRERERSRRRDRWRHLPALLVAVGFAVPVLFMVSGSLRTSGLPPPRTPELVPSPLAFDNYSRAYALVDIVRHTLNSTMVVAIAVPVTVVVSSLAGFAMASLPRRAAGAVVGLSLVALMVPTTALLVSRFALFEALRLDGTLWPLVAPSLFGTSPFYVLLFYWSFRRLPPELFEAARLEGMSELRIWYRVALPLANQAMVAVVVLCFVLTWSNFLDPLVYLRDERDFTVPLGLRSLAQLDRQDFPLFLAGAVTATAPVVGLLLATARYFLESFRNPQWARA